MKAHAAVAKKQLYDAVPRHKWVLVRKLTPEEIRTEAGVIVDKSQQRSLMAEVLDFGEAVVGLVKGDKVLISAFGMELEDMEEVTGDRSLSLLRDEEVYVILRPRSNGIAH
jgi:hypothetical protein